VVLYSRVAASSDDRIWLLIEYGYVLPEPGDEHVWAEALPREDREFMQTVGQ
jgi:hypothetical protein